MKITSLDGINWHALPVQIQEIAKRCGREAAEALLREYNGRKVLVPVPPVTEQDRLAQRIGLELAAAIARHYPGQLLGIPKCNGIKLAARDEAIREAYRNGASRADLAEQYDLTERWIDRIVSGEKPLTKTDRQLSMFDT